MTCSPGVLRGIRAMTTDMDRRYLSATGLAALSAVLHVIALPLGGFEASLGLAIIGAAIWAALALGLWQGFRFMAYLAFVMALIGISGALSVVVTSLGLEQGVWSAILVTDVLIALTLFILLWRPRPG